MSNARQMTLVPVLGPDAPYEARKTTSDLATRLYPTPAEYWAMPGWQFLELTQYDPTTDEVVTPKGRFPVAR